MNSISGINTVNTYNNVNKVNANPQFNFRGKTKETDEFVSTTKKALTKQEEKELVYTVSKEAAGWSILGQGFSTLYYGLRSDKNIADKYNLDAKTDTNLINKIRKQQTLCTLPAIFFSGILGYIGVCVFGKPDKEGAKAGEEPKIAETPEAEEAKTEQAE